jgi:arginyl-tRNA synthetase
VSAIRDLYRKERVKYIVCHLGIIDKTKGDHSNILLFDIDKKEVERFEPSGAYNPNGYNYNYERLDEELKTILMKIDHQITYYRPIDYEPVIGFLTKGSYDVQHKKLHDPKGYCISWCIWYIDMRLTYKEIPRKTFIYKMINQINRFQLSYKNVIRNFSSKITKQREQLLNEADIEFDSWLNKSVEISKILNVKKIITELI